MPNQRGEPHVGPAMGFPVNQATMVNQAVDAAAVVNQGDVVNQGVADVVPIVSQAADMNQVAGAAAAVNQQGVDAADAVVAATRCRCDSQSGC